MPKGGREPRGDETGAQEPVEADTTILTMIKMLREQQRMQMEQQRAVAAQQEA